MPDHEQWRNRIVGHGTEKPSDLLSNPMNFRTHPQPQADALSGVLTEVGFVQSVVVNQRSGHLIDGHLRVGLARERGEDSIPVVYVDLDEHEEALILATLDPIGALAGVDAEALDALLHEVSTGDAAIQALLDSIGQDAGIVPPAEVFPPAGFKEFGDDIETQYKCPSCQYEWSGSPKSDA